MLFPDASTLRSMQEQMHKERLGGPGNTWVGNWGSQGTHRLFLQRQQAALGHQSDREAKHLPNQCHGRFAAGMFQEL